MNRSLLRMSLALGALFVIASANAQISFFENHDSGSSFTNTSISGSNPWSLETKPLNAHTSGSYWQFREPSGVSDSVLTSPILNYSATTAGPVTLSFWHKFGFESGFDGGAVELQLNGGTWSNIGSPAWSQNGYTGTLSSNHQNPIGGQMAFTGNSAGFLTTDSTTNWINSIANLGTFTAGDTFAIRFHGGSDLSLAGNGWFIDEIRITANSAPVPEPATMVALGLGVVTILRRRRKI